MRQTLHAIVILALAAAAQAGEVVNWSSGVAYTYDGSGNVSQIGNDKFVYDDVGRIVRAQVNGAVRVYGFDAFGNRTKCSQDNDGTDCRYFTVDANDNRITGATYDGAGNVTKLGPHTYTYDLDNMMTRDDYNGAPREFIYTAEDERIAVYSVSPHTWDWTVRDTGGRPLRDFTSRDGANLGTDDLTWSKDYVWRDGGLLASRQREGTTPTASTTTTYHYHLDHLGTPRRITNDTDAIVGAHDYYPFGPEIFGGLEEPSATRLKYTGHERDAGTDEYTLDYMHARYYNGAAGRFLSVDAWMDLKKTIPNPQMWNRYTYVVNNPIHYTDPDGREHVNEPGFTKPLSEANDWSQHPSVSWAFNAEGFLLSLAADEFIIGPAVGKVFGAVGRFAGRVLGKSGEAAEAGATAELSFGRKLDFLFDRNIDQAVASNAKRAAGNAAAMRNAGIADTAANRALIAQRMSAAARDSATIIARNGERTTHQIFIMGNNSSKGVLIEFVQDGQKVITLIAKSMK